MESKSTITKPKERKFSVSDLIVVFLVCVFMTQEFVDSSLVSETFIGKLRAHYHSYGTVKMFLPFLAGGYYLWSKKQMQGREKDLLCRGISIVFAVLNTCGQLMYHTDHLPSNILDFILAVGYGWASSILFYHIFIWMMDHLPGVFTEKGDFSYDTKKLYLISFSIILLGWFVWMIPYYPASADWDVYYPIAQYLGAIDKSNQQPWFYSLIIGAFYRAGELYADKNAGMYAYIMTRAIIMSIIYSGMVVKLKKHGVSRYIVWGTVFFYAFVPVWGAYAKHAFKDTIGAALFTWYIMALTDTICELKKERIPPLTYVNYIAASLFACLFRHNCFYVILPATILLVAVLWVKQKGKKIFGRALGTILLCMGIFLFKGYEYYIYEIEHIIHIPAVEAMSLPIQQVARTVRDHSDRITPEEKQWISGLVDYEKMAELYDPLISDPVKFDAYYRETTAEDFLALWKYMLWKFPGSYLESAIALSYGYYSFTPDQAEFAGNRNCGMAIFDWTKDDRFNPDFTCDYFTSLGWARSALAKWAEIWHGLPGLGLTDVEAFYTWLIVLAGVILLKRKDYTKLIIIFALLLMIASCCVSPVNDCFRYYAPVAAAFPIVFFLTGEKKKTE